MGVGPRTDADRPGGSAFAKVSAVDEAKRTKRSDKNYRQSVGVETDAHPLTIPVLPPPCTP